MIKFSVAAFADAAKVVINIPGSASGIDILNHALVDAGRASLFLTMSDLDIEARVSVDCEADKPQKVAVPRAVLEFFIARAGMGDDAGTLTFDDEMKNVTARHGKARLTLAMLPGDDFFLMQSGEPEWTFTMRAHELCEALRRTEKALGTDANRIMLHGPFLHRRDGDLKLIGADGSRVHIVDIDEPEATGDLPKRNDDALPGIIMPPKTVKEMLRIFAGDESEIRLCGTARVMVIEAERVRLASKLIDATYFDYPRLVPSRTDKCAVVNGEALKRAMDGLLVAPKTDAKGRREAVRSIRMTLRDDTVELFTRGDTGDADDSVPARLSETNGAEGVSFEITFAAKFLRDAIDAAGAADITIHAPADFGLPFHIVGGEGATFVIGQRRM